MKNWWLFLREIPLLVWLAFLFAIAWLRKTVVRWRTVAKEPGFEIPVPKAGTKTGYNVRLNTGTYRRYGNME